MSVASLLVGRALAGDRRALAKILTHVEEGGATGREVVALLHTRTGSAWTVGITGPPGAGKSTLTDRLVATIRSHYDEVGVLAIDPSSPFTGGAILGDRVRMQDHSTDPGVFIRSMATRGHLGGLALATPHAMRVLDAIGKAWVIVETVGVGQVEVEVAGQADTTVVVVNPGWGDAVQAAKAGLLEIADVFVVNKADRPGVEETVSDLEAAVALSGEADWVPPVVRTTAVADEGTSALWEAIGRHREYLNTGGRLAARRRARLAAELRTIVTDRLERQADALCGGEEFDDLVAAVESRTSDPYSAADALLGDLA